MKIILSVILLLGVYTPARAAQDSVSVYGVTEYNASDRALLAVVGNIEVSTSSKTKTDPAIILNGKQRRLTVSDAGRVNVSTITPDGFYGKHYGDGSGLFGVMAVSAPGDNLGSHVATTTLNMNGNFINNAHAFCYDDTLYNYGPGGGGSGIYGLGCDGSDTGGIANNSLGIQIWRSSIAVIGPLYGDGSNLDGLLKLENGGLALGDYNGVNTAPDGGVIAPGNVGIGNPYPAGPLQVGSNIFTVLANGNIGIGVYPEAITRRLVVGSPLDLTITTGPATSGEGGYISSFTAAGHLYFVHEFKDLGLDEFIPPPGVTSVRYLVGAGAGGGAGNGSTLYMGVGGGAAGGILQGTLSVTPGVPVPVIVGAGGHATMNGYDSSLDVITSSGGGHGGEWAYATGYGGVAGGPIGGDGGSGGGAGSQDMPMFGYGIPGQGNNGGGGSTYAGGGGGGAGDTGWDTEVFKGGPGGDGIISDITGTPKYYGGGGGGGTKESDPDWIASGGEGGGGQGASYYVGASSGAENSCSGGGGANYYFPSGGRGGSGIVIVAYEAVDAFRYVQSAVDETLLNTSLVVKASASVEGKFTVGSSTLTVDNGDVLIGTTTASGMLTVEGQFHPQQVKAEDIAALVPRAAGNLICCMNCLVPFSYCVSKSKDAGDWVLMNSVNYCQ